MADLGKYGNCKTPEERKLVDEYMSRSDETSQLIAKNVEVFHKMRMTLERRSDRRTNSGHSLVKYDPFSGQGRIIAMLAKEDNLSQASLAQKLDVKPQTLSVAIKKLEARGLVSRNPDPLDARVQLVSLTQKGHELERGFEDADKYSGSMFEALSDEELRQALGIFQKLQTHLEGELAASQAVEGLLD